MTLIGATYCMRLGGLNMKRRPRKPADKFGAIVFGKDGSIRSDIDVLSSDKVEQEQSLSERFVAALRKGGIDARIGRLLEESDHDFEIKVMDKPVLIQAAELNKREYLRSIDEEEYMSGVHPHVTRLDDGYWAFDDRAMEQSLSRVVALKLAKNYATRSAPTWLLVWTTAPAFLGSYLQSGVRQSSPALQAAREMLRRTGSGPFSEIWLHNLITKPDRVWPDRAW